MSRPNDEMPDYDQFWKEAWEWTVQELQKEVQPKEEVDDNDHES